jgi:hypothetical protein
MSQYETLFCTTDRDEAERLQALLSQHGIRLEHTIASGRNVEYLINIHPDDVDVASMVYWRDAHTHRELAA